MLVNYFARKSLDCLADYLEASNCSSNCPLFSCELVCAPDFPAKVCNLIDFVFYVIDIVGKSRFKFLLPLLECFPRSTV